jgi:hypothetical protein
VPVLRNQECARHLQGDEPRRRPHRRRVPGPGAMPKSQVPRKVALITRSPSCCLSSSSRSAPSRLRRRRILHRRAVAESLVADQEPAHVERQDRRHRPRALGDLRHHRSRGSFATFFSSGDSSQLSHGRRSKSGTCAFQLYVHSGQPSLSVFGRFVVSACVPSAHHGVPVRTTSRKMRRLPYR